MSSTTPRRRPRKALGLLSAALLVAGLSSHAAAEEPAMNRGVDAAETRIVDASDLDLARAADATVLYLRIRNAATAMCRATEIEWDVKRVQRRRQCVRSSVERAVLQINAPLVTAAHRAELDIADG